MIEIKNHHNDKEGRSAADQTGTESQGTSIMSNEIVRATDVAPSPPPEYPVDQVVFTPPIDIFETPDGLILQADLPGVSSESLELQVQDNKLSLFGKVSLPIPSDARLIHQEYQVGHFLRSFILSDEVDHERITAKLSQGVLEVFLPRLPKPEPRRIQIQAD